MATESVIGPRWKNVGGTTPQGGCVALFNRCWSIVKGLAGWVAPFF